MNAPSMPINTVNSELEQGKWDDTDKITQLD